MKHSWKMNEYKVLVQTSEGNRALGRPRSRREDNITQDLQEVGWEGAGGWIHLAQDGHQWWALVTTSVNLQVSQISWNFLTG
jgi:hypothetical protein